MLALIKIPAHLGYLVLFGLVGAESTGVPVPGETALITAGVLAHHGRFNIELVIVIAAVAAILGDNIGYLIGRNGGRRLLARPGFLEGHRRQILEKGEPFFQRHGPKAVFLGRWVAGLRIAAAWLAGINRMPWHIFVFWKRARRDRVGHVRRPPLLLPRPGSGAHLQGRRAGRHRRRGGDCLRPLPLAPPPQQAGSRERP